MEFNTVDGFQGREVDILVLTTVRSSVSDSRSVGTNSVGIGFVADIRRMNVALTRAKISLWIVGNARTLQTNLHWATLVKNAKERNLFISVTRPYDSVFERRESFSRGSSYSSMNDTHSNYGKKNDTAKSSFEVKQDKNGDRDAHRMKTKFAGGKPVKHTTNKSGPSSSEGYKRMANHKNNKIFFTDVTTAHENPKYNREGSKAIPRNVQLKADSRVKTVIKDREANKFSGHATASKLSENTTSLLSSEKSSQRGNNRERSKPLDVKTTTKDLFAARKRQRDDIEALLPSALISSKKTGMPSNASTVNKPSPRNN